MSSLRRTVIEDLFYHVKIFHGLSKAKLIRLEKEEARALLTSTVHNLKRLGGEVSDLICQFLRSFFLAE